MDSETDNEDVGLNSEAVVEKYPEVTTENPPNLPVDREYETAENRQESNVETQPKMPAEKQSEAADVETQSERSVEKSPEPLIQEDSNSSNEMQTEMQNENTVEQATEEKLNEEEHKDEKQPITKIKIVIDETVSERFSGSDSISSTLSEEENGIADPKTLRRKIRAQKRKARLELLQKNDTADDSDDLQAFEKISCSKLLLLPEPNFSEDLSMTLEEEESSSSSEITSQQSENLISLLNRVNFIENFEDLPSLSDFSDKSSVDDQGRQSKRQSVVSRQLSINSEGIFVNPLTGEVESSSIESASQDLSFEEEIGEEELPLYGSDDEDNLDIQSMLEAPKDLAVLEDETKTFEAFAALKKKTSVESLTSETEDMILELQQRAITYEFLYQLIDIVVEKSELIDHDTLLSRNISKTKLFHKFVTQLTLLTQEKLLNNELVRKVTDYYKRLKNFRCIVALPLHVFEIESQKYSHNLMQLDYMLQKENETAMHSYLQTGIAAREKEEFEMKLEECENRLKDLILKTFGSSRLAAMKSRVESDLKVMAQNRAEISKARLALLQRQHTAATLKERLEAIEKISENLTLSRFIRKQTEVGKLDKKVEERYFEFNKLKQAFTSDVDKLAHVKEDSEFIEEKLKKQHEIYLKLIAENREKKERLYELKLEHTKIIRNIRERSFQSGLLERPALMYDYDDTTDELALQNEKVLQIQKKMHMLQSKIDEAEEKLSNQVWKHQN